MVSSKSIIRVLGGNLLQKDRRIMKVEKGQIEAERKTEASYEINKKTRARKSVRREEEEEGMKGEDGKDKPT